MLSIVKIKIFKNLHRFSNLIFLVTEEGNADEYVASGEEIEEDDSSEEGTESKSADDDDVEKLLGLDNLGSDSEKAVLEPPPLEGPTEPSIPDPPCTTSNFGCCSLNASVPSHGSRLEGCCLMSEFGCCPDQIQAAAGPDFKGCFCR